ncbi:MAG: glycoside hydrolase family 13 protein [Bacteroidota bacterium]
MMKKISLNILLLLFSGLILAQQPQHVEPPFWWAGMKHSELQLLVHGQDIGYSTPEFNYNGVKLKQTIKVKNPNYLFLDLEISPEATPGSFTIYFMREGKQVYSYDYELHDRKQTSASRQGFGQEDVIYLLMPDRFANGDTTNDSHPDMLEKADRSDPDGRHGGDLQGVMNHLSYFKELGATAVWLNPFLENNQQAYTYHGYAISDLYRVDPRHGSNELFQELVDKAHDKDIKIIMDMIMNHIGSGHYWMDDLPMNDWIHQFDEYTSSNYRANVAVDPHASEYDLRKMKDGWFDTHMPDLNQKNPLLARYLIQNTIWWIEYAGIDGIRMDTQPYPDEDFMADWAEYVMKEYPNFSIVGEAWIGQPSLVAYYQGGKDNFNGYDSHLSHVFDFPGNYAVSSAFNEDNGWDRGLARFYEHLSQDFLYPRPHDLLVFADNHDLSRVYTTMGENMDKLKMAMTYIFTVRGTPVLQYGTEILMTGEEHAGHGKMRKDFPGGWEEDEQNAFTEEGRTEEQNEIFNHIQKLIDFRQSSEVMQTGKLTQFIPGNDVYIYFRHLDDEAVMIAYNNTGENKTVDGERFSEIMDDYKSGENIITGKSIETFDQITVPAMSAMVVKLK